jgi:hypothetical protein
MLHIHNGDASGNTAKNSALRGEHLAWREALICGPTPGGLSDEEFINVRARHLAETYGGPIEDCANESRHQEQVLGSFRNHDEVVLWFEHDLFCQVSLVYLLSWFAQRDHGDTKLSLICIDQFPGFDDFRGLGQLNEQQLESLFPARTPISKPQLELGQRAWAAYSSSNPQEIESLISADTSALPFLKTALGKHLERFPSTRNGLGRIENVLLELIADGQTDFKSLFQAFQRREPIYGFGDAQIYLHLTRLANSAHAPFSMSNANAAPMDSGQVARTSFEINDRGKQLLRGEDDFVNLNGIDQWLGGVHLKGEERVWRWDDVAQTLECGD